MKNWKRLSRDTAETSALEIFKKRWDVSTRKHTVTATPTKRHRNVSHNFTKLPHPPSPDQQCCKRDTIARPTFATSDTNRIMPWYEMRLACFCNNFTSLTLNLTYNHHAPMLLSSLQSLNTCSQVFRSCTPQVTLLNISLCTLLKMPSCWFQDTRIEDAFEFLFWPQRRISKSVDLRIYSLLCYASNQ